MRTQVAIVGAGPSGLLISQILARHGVESVVVENRSREYVEARIRAGVVEHGAVDVLTEYGVGDRLHREGVRHDGVHLQWSGERHRIDFRRDVRPLRLGLRPDRDHQGPRQRPRRRRAAVLLGRVGDNHRRCGHRAADGRVRRRRRRPAQHRGRLRRRLRRLPRGEQAGHPEPVRSVHQRAYPYAWLGVLAQVAPSTDELIYAWHPDGFAMHSMRSHSVSRLYLQVDPDEDIGRWSDDRIWEALDTRLALDGWTLASGPTLEKSITPMRSFVSSPMRWGRLFLAGDAAHIVPPTGAKGLNLAIADVKRLGLALVRAVADGKDDLLDRYSDDALRRVWQSTYFSWWMTSMLHPPPAGDVDAGFVRRMQTAQLQYVTSSRAAATGLAENYTGSVLAWP